MTRLRLRIALTQAGAIKGEGGGGELRQGGQEGILGAAGVKLVGAGYAERTMHGWQRPTLDVVEVDLVGQAWFLKTEHVRHLFSRPAVTGTNGEDIELSARALTSAGIGSYCPPHPVGNRERWGSLDGFSLGCDEAAASWRVNHLAERDRIVRAELAAGWKPLFQRGLRLEACLPVGMAGDLRTRTEAPEKEEGETRRHGDRRGILLLIPGASDRA